MGEEQGPDIEGKDRRPYTQVIKFEVNALVEFGVANRRSSSSRIAEWCSTLVRTRLHLVREKTTRQQIS